MSSPGAKWAGVVHYIDLALTGDLQDFRPAYSRGISIWKHWLTRLPEECLLSYSSRGQTNVLEKLEHDQTAITKELSGREFFELMRKHRLEGFFSEPSTKATATRSVGMVLGFVG